MHVQSKSVGRNRQPQTARTAGTAALFRAQNPHFAGKTPCFRGIHAKLSFPARLLFYIAA
jgi:hypothetical protein